VDARQSVALSRAFRSVPLNAERFRKVDALFAEALEREGDERQQFLDARCAGDPDLRREVEILLGIARGSTEDFLETPVFDTAAALLAGSAVRTAGDSSRFVAGDIIATRYRIVGLLGRGGMGEVYRADDLRLGHPVALKFLAPWLARDGAALSRFHREVSVARQVSHANVCRVHDIGEHDGMHFLSMEYIRGEELSSLLKRIGRLPEDKAVDVIRQLCAGLAAIHDAGVLHRDLKPANIMIDERGDVRITDFGIAALSDMLSGREALIGTPAYMAPEQFQRGEVTRRSDIYALGLVIHECFTGKRRKDAPEGSASQLDARIERVVARCLEEDPAKRPASALQVAAAMPGGDPIAAALAAGETPSPQMVAASYREGSLTPSKASALALGIVLLLALLAVRSDAIFLHHATPLDRDPALLRDTATRIASRAGVTARDHAWNFELDLDVLAHLRSPAGAAHWKRLRSGSPAPVVFWYRQSAEPLVGTESNQITLAEPPMTRSSMVTVRLDPRGHLLSFEAVPPQIATASATASTRDIDWSPFFADASLAAASFVRTTPQWTPPHHSDSHLAWRGSLPGEPAIPVRIEAASLQGRPVWFQVIGPWDRPARQVRETDTRPAFTVALLVFYFGALFVGSVLAWKNLRQGRGDRSGALKLIACTFVVRMTYWLVWAHHIPGIDELGALVAALQSALYWCVSIAILYLALEPAVRRRWPEWLVSWSRLFAGEHRDPLVGRDILFGGLLGAAFMTVSYLRAMTAPWSGPAPAPALASPLLYSNGLQGGRGALALLTNQLSAAFLFSFILITFVLLFALLTRNRRAALALTWVVFAILFTLELGSPSLATIVAATLKATLLLLAISRFGVLTLVTMMFFIHFSVFYPVTRDLTAWYATSFLVQCAVLLGLTIYGLRTALGGQRLPGARLLDEV
jgi:serine/threonine protein kinase